MKLNKKVRYGLRAMIEIYKNKSSTGILQKEISAAQEIPLKYLDSIITGLRNAGLIANYSGKSSGYVLSRSPGEISVYDIYRAFEPELCLVDCSNPSNDCNLINNCSAKDFWFEMNNKIKNSMKSFTLDQFV
jgi:Rrf2 family protein